MRYQPSSSKVIIVDSSSKVLRGLSKALKTIERLEISTHHGFSRELATELESDYGQVVAMLIENEIDSPAEFPDLLGELHKNYKSITIVGMGDLAGSEKHTAKPHLFAEHRNIKYRLGRPADYLEATSLIRSLLEEKQMARKLVERFAKLTCADSVLLWRFDSQNDEFRALETLNVDFRYRSQITMGLDHPDWSQTFLSSEIVTISNLHEGTPAWFQHREEVLGRNWSSFLSLPFRKGSNLLGFIDAFFETPGKSEVVASKVREMLALFCDLAVDYLDSMGRLVQSRQVQQLSRNLLMEQDEAQVLARLLVDTANYNCSEFGWIYYYNRSSKKLVLQSTYGLKSLPGLEETRDLGEGITGWVAKNGWSLYVKDTLKENSPFKPVTGLEIRSQVSVPIRRHGQTVGVLSLVSTKPEAFSNDDIRVVISAVDQSLPTLESVKLTSVIRQIWKFSREGQIQELYSYVIESISEILEVDVLLLLAERSADSHAKVLKVVAETSTDHREEVFLYSEVPLQPGTSISSEVFESQKTVVRNNLIQDRRVPKLFVAEAAKHRGWKSCAVSAVSGLEGECLGTLAAFSRHEERFHHDETNIIEAIAHQMAVGLQQRQKSAAIELLASTKARIAGLLTTKSRDLLNSIADYARDISDADCVVLYSQSQGTGISLTGKAISGKLKTYSAIYQTRKRGIVHFVNRYGCIVADDLPHGSITAGFTGDIISASDLGNLRAAIEASNFLRDEGFRSFVAISLRLPQRPKSKSEELGIIFINYLTSTRLTSVRIRLIEIFADLVGAAIHNANNFVEIERKRDELQRTNSNLSDVNKVTRHLLSKKNPRTSLHGLIRVAMERLGGTGGKVYIADPNHQRLRLAACINVDQRVHPIGSTLTFRQGAAGRTISSGRVVVVDDYRNWKGRVEHLSKMFRSVIDIPLKISKKTVGVLSIFHKQRKKRFKEEDALKIEHLIRQAPLLVYQMDLQEKYRQKAKILAPFQEAARSLAKQNEFDKIVQAIATGAADLLTRDISIRLGAGYLECEDETTAVNIYSYKKEFVGLKFDLRYGLLAKVMRSKSSRYKNNFHRWRNCDPSIREAGLADYVKNVIEAPIIIDGEIVAVLVVTDRSGKRAFSKDDRELLDQFTALASIAIENSYLFERNRKQLEQLKETRDELSLTLDFLSDARNLAVIGLVYGETLHFARNRLGWAKTCADDILVKDSSSSGFAKEKAREIKRHISEYLKKVDSTQERALSKKAPINLKSMLDDVIGSKRFPGEIRLEKSYDWLDGEMVVGPEPQLRQVFFVLLQNSIDAVQKKFRSQEGGEIRVSAVDLAPERSIEIRVVDNGQGMTQANEENLFRMENISRGKDLEVNKEGDRKGRSGMGLSWARSFMRMHGGNLTHHSILGEGTSMFVTTPRDFRQEVDLPIRRK